MLLRLEYHLVNSICNQSRSELYIVSDLYFVRSHTRTKRTVERNCSYTPLNNDTIKLPAKRAFKFLEYLVNYLVADSKSHRSYLQSALPLFHHQQIRSNPLSVTPTIKMLLYKI